ncbi:DUF7848 domain-containing protein [Streptomyces sp. URMC 123]|uniref:DUF7848 domain-containing protein n=1 Tax=Streptomyces sp. URMC 123 TaxID=3423403 RepID=UPI003F1C87E1
MTRTLLRFLDFTLRRCRDEDRRVKCVTSVPGPCPSVGFMLTQDCGAESEWLSTEGEVTDWMRKHTSETRHLRYERTKREELLMDPPGSLPAGTEILPEGWTPP